MTAEANKGRATAIRGLVRENEHLPRSYRSAITIAFVSGIAISVLMVILSYRTTSSLIENSSWLTHTQEVLGTVGALESSLERAESIQGRYLLTGNELFLESFENEIKNARTLDARLEVLTTDNAAQQNRLRELKRRMDSKIEHMRSTVEARRREGLTPELEQRVASEGKRRMDEIRATISDIASAETELYTKRSATQRRSAENSLRSILIGGTIALVFLGLAGLVLQRDIRRRLLVERQLQSTTALQRAILNSSNYAIFSTGPGGTIVTFNAAAERLFGYHSSEVIGRLTPLTFHEPAELVVHAAHMSRFLAQEVKPNFDALVGKAKLGTTDESEWNLRRRDGTSFAGLLSTSAMHDENGSITGYVFIVIDISQRKEAERAKELLERRHRALLQNSSDMVVVIDAAGRIQYISPAVERLLDFTVSELVGREIFDLLHPADTEAARHTIYNVATHEGFSQPEELRFRKSNGEPIIAEMVANNLLNDQVLHGIVLNVRDISERARAKSHLELQNAVARVLANAVDLTQSIPEILQALCNNLEWELSEFWGVDQEQQALTFNFAWSLPGFDLRAFLDISQQTRIHLGEGLAGRVWESARAMQVSDISHEENFVRRTELESLSVKAAVGFPIQSREAVIGVFTLFSLRNRHVDDDLLTMLNTVGAQIGQFIARKRAEQQISENEDRYHYLFENSADLIMTFAPDGTILHINAAWPLSLGYSRDDLVKMNMFDLVLADERDAARSAIDRALTAGSLDKAEFTFRTSDGHLLIAEGSINCRYGISGVEYCNAIFQDVTKRREVDQMKNEFISVVSHELRTPLTSIRGSLGLLSGGVLRSDPDKAQRMLEIALKNTERLVRLINDILDIEKIESGKISLDIQPVDAADLILQATATMHAMAESAKVKLEVRPLRGTVYADRDRMMQTLTNLLSNAIKFSPTDSRITVATERRGSGLLIRVRDQGRGIPVSKLQTIFERFQQVDASDSRDKGGTGLGLAICRSIVQQHGGSIWVDSAEGKGSEFFVLLPRFQPESSAVAQTSNSGDAALPS